MTRATAIDAVRRGSDYASQMALALTLLVILVLVLAAASSLTPWPFPTALLLIGLCTGGIAALVTGSAFLIACAALLPICVLLALRTISQTLDNVAAARRAARPRRRRHDATTTAATAQGEEQARRAA